MERLKSYNWGDISRIINKASKIGEGAFGEVYLGKDGSTSVAVKVLSKSSWQGRKEFLAELRLSSRAHHGNLVSLLGYCDHCKKMALVYEFMANGNLEEHLSGKKPNVLTWNERLQIALDVALGLDYLHNGCNPAIIHRDLKTSNILLSENMVAKISDFGLSRASTTKSGGYKSSTPIGTPGYLAPEYEQSHSLNKKGDVYSFGIVLFELITGHPVIMERTGRKSVHILEYVTPLIKNENNMLGLMDQRLKGFDPDSAREAVNIAELCTRANAADRLDISEVLTRLKGSLPRELAPETK